MENVINFKASCFRPSSSKGEFRNENEIQESSVYGIKLTPSDIPHKIKNLKYFTHTCLLSDGIPYVQQSHSAYVILGQQVEKIELSRINC